MDRLNERIMGCLAMSALGDALGTNTESLDCEQAAELLGENAQLIRKPTFGNSKEISISVSSITNDFVGCIAPFSAVYRDNEAHNAAESQGNIIDIRGRKVSWGRDFIKPNNHVSDCEYAISRSAVAGLFNPGQHDNAIYDVCAKLMPQNATLADYSGAAAIAAGISQAVVDSDALGVYDACLHGAREGERFGKRLGKHSPGASVEARIRLAMRIATSNEPDEVSGTIAALLGSSDTTSEAVPAAIGHFLGSRGDPLDCVVSSVLAGGASRLIASIAGQLGGALRGINRCPRDICSKVDCANALWLSGWSEYVFNSIQMRYPISSLCSNA